MKINLTNAAQIEIAAEIARIVGKSLEVSGKTLTIEEDDAVEAKMVASDAERYWKLMRKTTNMKAASNLREKFAEIEASARYALSFAR